MVFSSLVFVCVFFPIVLILHTVIRNRKMQNALLLIASLLFYAYGEPVYIFLMLASALLNYLFALLLGKSRSKLVLALAVAVNIGLLGVFKYTGFVMTNVNAALGLSLPVPQISLPIGISFFTFQALSYVIDVYRGEVAVQRSYAKLLLYISFFPQLIAGPIVRYVDVAREIDERTVSTRKISFGLRRFIVGLGKKVLIANAMSAAADYFFNHGAANLNMLGAWIGAIAYLMQIYYDFSGYSDMAIGLGKMFGFDFLENFNYPYIARNITDFWRRWHISLSSWFRDYVYIPLGGNRRGNRYFNLSVVFLLTGMWHGASWNYILWGIWHGIFSIVEKPLLKRNFYKKVPYPITWLFTMLIVLIGWVLFRLENLSEALKYLGVMFGAVRPDNVAYTFEWFFNGKLAAVLACAVLASVPWKNILGRIPALKRFGDSSFCHLLQNAATVALLLLGVVLCMTSTYNPFIYFRF